MKDTLKLIIIIVICEAAGFIGSLFTTPAIPAWYQYLERPGFAPPSWVFAPVWTLLFALMGLALFLVLKNGLARHEIRAALGIFIAQLILNVFWSIIFFSWRSPGWAFVEILFLLLAIIATIVSFCRVSKPAAWLLSPYIAWVGFAAYLNLTIWLLNR